jgi:hypothetical protein
MVGGGRPAAGEIEEGGVVRRHGSTVGHGWRWPAVRPVLATGGMEELGAATGELEEDWAAAAELEEDRRQRQRFQEEEEELAH